jgi:hypothetical protein
LFELETHSVQPQKNLVKEKARRLCGALINPMEDVSVLLRRVGADILEPPHGVMHVGPRTAPIEIAVGEAQT